VIALTATLPLTILIVVCIKLDSRGPIFYRVRRVGYQGRPLMMLKFRKMHQGATGAPLTAKADPRLTRVGGFLTRWRLDELPQFWDVLMGRMSILGPRPEDPRFVAIHLADYEHILAVRPGIVGLAQLAYEAETSIVSDTKPIEDYVERIMPQKVILDKLYAAHTSWRLDLSIALWAVVALVLRRPVAVSRTTGAMSVRAPRAPTPPPAELAMESMGSSVVTVADQDRAPHPAGASVAD
jgi:lipopolysaccharide/colanic/teichoic acid biosynthesis glycosyltransferase